VLRLEPVRLAGILAAVSTSVLIARTLLTRKIPVVGALLIYVAAAGGGAALAFTLPAALWPAMIGALALRNADALFAAGLPRSDRLEGGSGRSGRRSIRATSVLLSWAGHAAILAALILPPSTFAVHIPVIRLHGALQLDRHRIARPVPGDARGEADPAFADAVLINVGLLHPLEADADAALQRRCVVEGAVGISGQAIGRSVGHAGLCGRVGAG
jgi:hypothetical protein